MGSRPVCDTPGCAGNSPLSTWHCVKCILALAVSSGLPSLQLCPCGCGRDRLTAPVCCLTCADTRARQHTPLCDAMHDTAPGTTGAPV